MLKPSLLNFNYISPFLAAVTLDNNVLIKIFLDYGGESIKVNVNMVTTNKGNSVDKHLCALYAECCETYYNLRKLFQVHNIMDVYY